MAFKKVNQINDIPLHYARTQAHPYGTRGVQTTFRMERKFHKTLEACLEEVFAACPLGKPEVITSAGAFVNKRGAHGRGTAVDIDGLFWPEYTMLATSFPSNTELYLGIESFLRKHFGIVLNYVYNAAHEDHWHVDNSITTSFSKRSRSKVLYLQLTLKHVYRLNVIVDGLYGPQTENAYAAATERVGLSASLTKRHWLRYLDKTGRIAFGLFERKNTPRGLLNNVYQLAGEQPPAVSRPLLEALNAFSDHPDTLDWLGSMQDEEVTLAQVIREVG